MHGLATSGIVSPSADADAPIHWPPIGDTTAFILDANLRARCGWLGCELCLLEHWMAEGIE